MRSSTIQRLIERTPSGLRPLGAFIFAAATALAPLLAPAALAQSGRAERVLIYYANETTPAAAQSRNYAVLLQTLRAHGGSDGAVIADEIADDSRISPAVVQREIDALTRSCGRLRADIAVFTNALASSGKFLFCRAAAGVMESLPFAGPPPAADRILNRTPLSRPEYLRAALARVAAAAAPSAVEAILFTHSHGGIGMALMPRVSADVEDLDASALRHILQIRGGTPDWATLKGTSKLEFWRVLSDAGRAYGMRFALVFRQACESGPDSMAEYRAIPGNVVRIAHTAMADLPYGKIDYTALLAAATAPDPVEGLVANLSAQGMHVDGTGALLLWLVPVYLWSIPSALFFVPLALWLGWLGIAYAANARRIRSALPKPA